MTKAVSQPRKQAQGLARCLAAAIALGGPCVTPAAVLAQQNRAAPEMPPPSPADDRYVAPRVQKTYIDGLAALPDWNGNWQGDQIQGRRLCFDCANFYVAPDPAAPEDAGRLPTFPAGSKNTAIPYKPEYQKLYDDTIAKAVRGGDTDPDNCIRPHQMPDVMGTGFGGMEIIVTPSHVRMTWDWLNGTRRIYTDGRPHPGPDDLWLTYMGHSIGHWEGDTLVVDTVGVFAGFYDQTGAPHSDKVHITERIRMIAPDKLENRLTVEDPVMLTRPFTVRRTYTRTPQPRNALLGSYCSDERDSNTAVPASLIK